MSKTLAQRLDIPVNPEYQWGHNPELQAEYVNPVELSNRTILYANAYIAITSKLVESLKELGIAKTEKTNAETALQDFEQDLLCNNPPTAGDNKNIATLNSYILRTVSEYDSTTEYKQLKANVSLAESALIDAQTKIEVHRANLNSVEHACQQIQTHLSFIKAEHRQAKNYT